MTQIISSLMLCWQEETLFSGCGDKNIYMWDLESGNCKVKSGADEYEHATPLFSCHCVFIDRFILDQISLEWDSHESALTNHKKLIDVTASLDQSCLSFTKEKLY